MEDAATAGTDDDTPAKSERSVRALWFTLGVVSLVALVSAGIAVYAMAQANMAHDLARDAHGSASQALAGADAGPNDDDVQRPVPTEPDDTIGTSTAEPDSEPSEPEETEQPDALSPRAQYSLTYENETVTPTATIGETCIDIDEHRVVIEGDCRNDIQLSIAPCDVPCFREVRGMAAQADTADLGPEDCADRINRSPLPSDATVPAQRGTVLCVVTSRSAADSEGIPQRIAVLEVTGRDEEEVSVRLTAWEVPT